ncbi:MAG: pyruvate dehydrogenase (acetyl-transferring) E1 component subunit alpha [Planctomycetota bacterium]|jgi:pyruvate dehydrogenase E1 component alpha subunit
MIIDEHDPLEGKMFQVIDKDGNLVGDDPGLPEDLLKDMYRWMLLTRMADEKAVKLQRQGRMGTYAPSKGQEAAQVGSALAMEEDDWLFPAFRELGAYMIRGFSLEYDLMYFMGDPRGNQVPEDSLSMPIYVPVGTQIPQAVGFAHAMRYHGVPDAVMAYIGDGGTSAGDFHEGMNMAGVLKAPVVVVVNNNQWAISVPRSKQTASKTIAQKAVAYGLPGVQVDGNDVMAMYMATKEALDRARAGEGATLIEAVTYRLMMHTTADDPSRYRTDEEQAEWEGKDPLKRFRAYLETKGIWTSKWQEELEVEAKATIDTAIEKAESLTELSPEVMFEHLFEEMPDNLLEQLEYLEESIASREIEEDAEHIPGGFP